MRDTRELDKLFGTTKECGCIDCENIGSLTYKTKFNMNDVRRSFYKKYKKGNLNYKDLLSIKRLLYSHSGITMGAYKVMGPDKDWPFNKMYELVSKIETHDLRHLKINDILK